MTSTASTWRTSSFSGNDGPACVEVATWRTSSFSGAGNDCVELGAWRTSPLSDHQHCVELAGCACGCRAVVGVRDTKRRDAGTLVLPDAARTALLAFARR